jgi:hypothetical protein
MIYFLIYLLVVIVLFAGSALYYRITGKDFESTPWDDVLPNAVLLGLFIVGWPVAVPVFMFDLVFIQTLPWLWRKIARQ